MPYEETASPGAHHDLPRNERAFIVLLALLQGLLLYLAQYGHDHGIWPLSELQGRVCWYTLVLTVPTVMQFTLQRLGQPRYWLQSGVITAVSLLLALWATYNATGAPGLEAQAVLGPFGVSLAIAAFVLLPFLQSNIARGVPESAAGEGSRWPWRTPYPQLFDLAWQNSLTLIFAGVAVALGWAILALWGALFALIEIRFFRELFREQAFIYLATGLMFGLGVLTGRTQERPVRIARQILFALFAWLLPLLSLIALLFIASLPFTGLEPLWRTRHATPILATVLGFLVVLINTVVQDGEARPPYPRWLARLVSAAVLASPLFAGLALYALSLRVSQYGWTPERIWAAVIVALLSLLAGGYALMVLRGGIGRGDQEGLELGWLEGAQGINIAASLLLAGVVLLLNSPLLDPHRISIASQLGRFEKTVGDAAKTLDLGNSSPA